MMWVIMMLWPSLGVGDTWLIISRMKSGLSCVYQKVHIFIDFNLDCTGVGWAASASIRSCCIRYNNQLLKRLWICCNSASPSLRPAVRQLVPALLGPQVKFENICLFKIWLVYDLKINYMLVHPNVKWPYMKHENMILSWGTWTSPGWGWLGTSLWWGSPTQYSPYDYLACL